MRAIVGGGHYVIETEKDRVKVFRNNVLRGTAGSNMVTGIEFLIEELVATRAKLARLESGQSAGPRPLPGRDLRIKDFGGTEIEVFAALHQLVCGVRYLADKKQDFSDYVGVFGLQATPMEGSERMLVFSGDFKQQINPGQYLVARPDSGDGWHFAFHGAMEMAELYTAVS